MKMFTKALCAVAVASLGSVAGAADFGRAPGVYYGTSANSCPGGVCPPGQCTTGDCLVGGCATGNCNVAPGSNFYGNDPRYNGHRLNSPQATNTQAYYGGGVRPYPASNAAANCPGGICPPVSGVSHAVGYRPQAPAANCATGNCPTPAVQRYPVYQAPRFSFLGLRF